MAHHPLPGNDTEISMPLDAAIDETDIHGTQGSKIYWFEEFANRAAIKLSWLNAIQHMPPRHMPYVCWCSCLGPCMPHHAPPEPPVGPPLR